ncbi:sigma-E factor negative regulatory protein [Parahaliea sp. F7430]|uniref:Sigma-E factor negative regulatory protein n=1 Tax=Sediminihaliea albiluteola TaxID=2758564 RepID=A0A7W2TVB2_9GAMM|nr:sigma-E factor negative regulatory protein [Sediminihaliea albiluteola]MBA6412543.1 sigma-E factor negative regulatory protein [Sediminihaliea albiluteola]
MSERMRESLSALMDGEAEELELERVLRQIGDDSELRQTWVRYHAVAASRSGQPLSNLNVDISSRVQAAISAEKAHKPSARWQGMWRPVASFAVAASVAATVVLGGQHLSQLSTSGDSRADTALAGGVSPVGLVNSFGATSVQASYGTSSAPVLQPAARTAYQELARQRMQQFSQEHAEQAALNTPQGLLPFTRVHMIQE